MTIHISGGGGGRIKQYETDPTKPVTDRTNVRSKNLWVLHTSGAGVSTSGSPMGLLLVLTYAETAVAGADTYQLSVNTTAGITRLTIPA